VGGHALVALSLSSSRDGKCTVFFIGRRPRGQRVVEKRFIHSRGGHVQSAMARSMVSLYNSKCGAMLVDYRMNKAELGPVEYWISQRPD
jgi:hypothetical protein